jgi:hypothetical protein
MHTPPGQLLPMQASSTQRLLWQTCPSPHVRLVQFFE